jgi:alpha-amylase
MTSRAPVRLALLVCALALSPLSSILPAQAQANFDDDRVMLQGFFWESHRYGKPGFPQASQSSWYDYVKTKVPAIAAGRFNLIWLPPPSYAGPVNAGYSPKQYFNLNTSYGSEAQQRQLLQALLAAGVEPVADVVINHRDGTNGWVDFQNPAWKVSVICRTDEAFTNADSKVTNTPLSQRADCEEPVPYRPGGTFNYESYRDFNHADPVVQKDILRYLLQLKSLGYRGWRYDMVHGYGARWLACYNAVSKPDFAVGEYDWDKQGEMRGWIWATSLTPQVSGVDRLRRSTSVFDFPLFFRMKDLINQGRYGDLYGYNFGSGLIGDTTDSMPWKQRSVTFVENHDTGYRQKSDGSPDPDHRFDSFSNGWPVEQAYALVLTHPGVPSVYWKHYFEWGDDLQNKIKALINARKVAGVHAGSDLFLQDNARRSGVYAAAVRGRQGMLYVRVGGSDANWQPAFSGYRDYREYAQGAGWKVWVALPGNPPFRFAGLPTALPAAPPLQPLPVPLPSQCSS